MGAAQEGSNGGKEEGRKGRGRGLFPSSLPPFLRSTLRWLGAVLLGLGALGCETAVSPFEESGWHYSIYGFLDASADTQFVRVVPLRDSVLAGPGPIDAEVRLTDLTTGETTLLRDSVFAYEQPSDLRGHVFWLPLAAEPTHTYHLEVRRADGATSRATVTVPEQPADPVLADTSDVGMLRPVLWPGVRRVAELGVVYLMQVTDGPLQEVFISYGRRYTLTPEGITFSVDMFRDARDLYALVSPFPGTPRSEITLLRAHLRLAVANEEWTFVGTDIPIETLAFPSAGFSNVEEGLGFFGGVARRFVPWRLPHGVVVRMGYTDGQERDVEEG